MAELNEHIRQLRSEYSLKELNESEVNKSPFIQFENWLKEAIAADILEPHAMTLSTVSKDGKPSSRIVLLRNVSTKGFIFYTNYNSKKGIDIIVNPNSALNFYWPQIERQVRVDGVLEKVSEKTSDEYFQSRPRESYAGCLAAAW